MSPNTATIVHAGLDIAKANLQLQGRRSLGGGRAALRRTLYMAALVAAHRPGPLQEFYQRLRAAGKPAKVALTAVMRKLIIRMNHVLKNPPFSLAT